MKKKIYIPIVFFVLFMLVSPCFSQNQAPVKKSAQQAYDKETEQAIKKSQDQIKYTSQKLRDPFSLSLPQEEARPVAAGPLPQFKVEGYVWGSSIPQAIINGVVYNEGDMVQGAKIVKIDKSGITLLYSGSNYVIK